MKRPDLHVEKNLQRFRPMLVSLAETLISPAFGGDLEASDLVQQTLLEAHRNTELLATLGDAPFFQWLRQALRHNVLDAVRNLKTQKNDIALKVRGSDLEESFVKLEHVLVADETSPSQVVQRNEQIAIMLSALQELPDNQRTAVIMKHLRGHSLKEVAEALGLTESATAGLLHRGRRKLVGWMEDQSDDE